MNDKPKILAFAGSLRHDSYNKKLIKIAIKGASDAGATVTYIDLRDYPLPLYDQEIEDAEGLPENAQKIKDLMIAHEALLISSPEYNSSVSGVLKNAIDWASRPSNKEEADLICFKGKVAALMSASPSYLGGLRVLVHLRAILGNIGVLLLPEQQTIPNAPKAFGPDGQLLDKRKQEAVYQHGAKLTKFLLQLKK